MIDTEALRKKVIDLAIQGKLTEQLPEDGNAEELYQQIQAEKTQLINEKKIKKEKPLPKITAKEIPFEIPKNWKWVRIGDLVKCSLGGGTPSKNVSEYWKNGDIPWASVKDFSAADAGYLNDTIDHITHDGLNNSASNMVDENAIIICMRMALGKVVRFLRPMAINQDLRAIWLHDCVDKSYFMYMYSTFNVEGRGTTVAGIRKDELRSFLFPLPPLSEQKRIVAKIDEVLAEIKIIDELQSQYASNVEVLKSKIIDAGIRGQLTEQLPEDGNAEELYQQIQAEKAQLIKEKKIKKEKPMPEITAAEIPFEIPSNWKWVRIGDIFQLHAGKNVKANCISNRVDETHQYLCYGGNGIRGYVADYNCDGAYPLIGRQGALCGNVHFAEGKFYATEHAVVTDTFANTDVKWAEKFLKALCLNQYATATAQPGLAVNKIEQVLIPLPPLSEQKRIVAKIDSVLGAIGK